MSQEGRHLAAILDISTIRLKVCLVFLIHSFFTFPLSSQTPVFIWEGGSNTVNQLSQLNQAPSARYRHTAWNTPDGKLWIFGGSGIDANGDIGYLNDLWSYDPTSDRWSWVSGDQVMEKPGIYENSQTILNKPGSRINGMSWTTSDGKLWLFGGWGFDVNGNKGHLNDLWSFDPATKTWTWESGSNVKDQGGVYGDGSPSTLNVPGSRSQSVTWVTPDNKLWLMGGNGREGIYGLLGYLNDLWVYDITTREWAWVSGSNSRNQPGIYGDGSPSTNNIPGARFDASSWITPDGRLWLFGGNGYDKDGQTGDLNDLWVYDPLTKEWTWESGLSDAVTSSNDFFDDNLPRNRQRAVAMSSADGRLWLFGGFGWGINGLRGNLNDLWIYNPSTGIWDRESGTGIVDQAGQYGDGSPSTGNIPGTRTGAAGFSLLDGEFWVYGGWGSVSDGVEGYFNDLWNYSISAKTWRWVSGSDFEDLEPSNFGDDPSTFSIPGARHNAQSWLSNDNKLLMFGGEAYGIAGWSQYSDDLWAFDPSADQWAWDSRENFNYIRGSYGDGGLYRPGGRHSSISWTTLDGKLALFGGQGLDANGLTGYFNDLWLYDRDTKLWTWESGSEFRNQRGTYGDGTLSPDNIPGGRINSVSWRSDDGRLWLFGGFGFDAIANQGNLNDLWSFDPVLKGWTWEGGSNLRDQGGEYGDGSPSVNNIPGARSKSISWVTPDGKVWLFGGSGRDAFDLPGLLNDLWYYDHTTKEWTWVSGSKKRDQFGIYGDGNPSGSNIPGARESAISWVDMKGRLWLFGGFGYDVAGSKGHLNDLWSFDPTMGEWTWEKGSQTIRQVGIYSNQNPSRDNIPGAREEAISWTTPDGRMWLFGGYGLDSNTNGWGRLNDLWTINFIPIEPNSLTAFESRSSSFQISWAEIVDYYPSEYYEVDISADPDFTSFVNNYQSFVTTSNGITVQGLSPATQYFVRVRSGNYAGISGNSLTVGHYTTPVAPIVTSATAITQNSFTANWNAVTGAEDYYLIVSENNDLSNPLVDFDGTVPLPNTTLSVQVVGLNPGMTYYYGAMAGNAGGKSDTSQIMDQITIPADPEAFFMQDRHTTTSFVAEWKPSLGATKYYLEVSEAGNDFTVLIDGYDPAIIDAPNLEKTVTGLQPNTSYEFRVYAWNDAGKSGYFNIAQASTLSVQTPLEISSLDYSEEQELGVDQTISITVIGGILPYNVSIGYRGILESSFHEAPMVELSPGEYSFEILPSYLDQLGLVFEVHVTDAGSTTISEERIVYVAFGQLNSLEIDFERYGGNKESWNLFSIPYELDNGSVSNVFSEYDQGRHEYDWRIVRYRNGQNDYINFNSGQFRLGDAYWFNAKENLGVKIENGNVTKQIPFTLVLSEGWNLIGNPYPIPISWSKVLGENPNAIGVGSLQGFNGVQQVTRDILGSFDGAFVWSDNSDFLILDPAKVRSGGRTEHPERKIKGHDIDSNEWMIEFFQQWPGGKVKLGGIGMHPEASILKDEYDEMTVPRFFTYTDLATVHNEYFYPRFSVDIVPSADQHNWNFTLSSNTAGNLSYLSWDQGSIKEKQSELYLVDRSTGRLTDMRSQDVIAVDLTRSDFIFDVYYCKEGIVLPGNLFLGTAYPNPAATSTTIPLVLPTGKKHEINLSIFDVNGRLVKTLYSGSLDPGFHEFNWDFGSRFDQRKNGLFIYRLLFTDNSYAPVQKKLIIR